MSDIDKGSVPYGFELLEIGFGFTDNLRPLYRRVDKAAKTIDFGMVIGPNHSNIMGICHGGALMTLADIAAASGANLVRGIVAGAPTINLSMDFVAAAKQGDWIATRLEGVELKRLFGFTRGVVEGERGVVARFNATFYFPDHPGMSQDGVLRPGALKGVLDD